MTDPAPTVSLLQAARRGEAGAVDALFPIIYEELRGIAHRHLARRAGMATLSTTELVHETYLKLMDGANVEWRDQAHFAAIASRAMRFLLVDRARARSARKRGGPARPVTLDDEHAATSTGADDLLAIDDALERLAAVDSRLGHLVEYRFYAGMNYEEIAEVTGRSVPTAKRDWVRARAWLYRFMGDDPESVPE